MNIQERSLEYGVRAVTLFRFLQKSKDGAGIVIAKQYLRSATSIGANLEEANAAETKADFVHKCSIAQKEARECLYWLRLMMKAKIVQQSRVRSRTGNKRIGCSDYCDRKKRTEAVGMNFSIPHSAFRISRS